MSFQVVIVTPERQVLDETFESVVLPAHDGQIGVLTVGNKHPTLASSPSR